MGTRWGDTSAHVCEEEYKRRSDAILKVLVRIPVRTGRSDPESWWLPHMSKELAHASITGDTADFDFEGMNKKREREKLREIQTLARKLSRAMRGLHYHARDMLWFASIGVRYADMAQDDLDRPAVSEADEEFWRRFWQTIPTLDHIIDAALPESEAWIDNAPELGKREQRIIGIIDTLEIIWWSLTGAHAPNYIGASGPFAEFLADALAALDIEGNPRSLFESWRKYRVNHQNGG
jgi:hypothetical protein